MRLGLRHAALHLSLPSKSLSLVFGIKKVCVNGVAKLIDRPLELINECVHALLDKLVDGNVAQPIRHLGCEYFGRQPSNIGLALPHTPKAVYHLVNAKPDRAREKWIEN